MTATVVDRGHGRSSVVSSTWDPSLESMGGGESPDNIKRRQQQHSSRAGSTTTTRAPLTAPLPAKHSSPLNALRSRIPAPPLSPGRKRGRLSLRGGAIVVDSGHDEDDTTGGGNSHPREQTAGDAATPAAPSSPVRAFGTIKDRLKYFDRNAASASGTATADRKLVRTPFKAAKAKVGKSLPFVQLDDFSGHSSRSSKSRGRGVKEEEEACSSRRLSTEPSSPSGHGSTSSHHLDVSPSPTTISTTSRRRWAASNNGDAAAAPEPSELPAAWGTGAKPKLRLLSGLHGASRKSFTAEALESPSSSSHRSSDVGRDESRREGVAAPAVTRFDTSNIATNRGDAIHSPGDGATTKRAGRSASRGRVPRPTSPVRKPVQLTLSGCVANLDSLSTSSHHRRGLFLRQASGKKPSWPGADSAPPEAASTPPPSFKETVGATYQRAIASAIPIRSKLSDLARNLSNHDAPAAESVNETTKSRASEEKLGAERTVPVKVQRGREPPGDFENSNSSTSSPKPSQGSIKPTSRLRAPNSAVPTKSKLSDLMMDVSLSSHTSATSLQQQQQQQRDGADSDRPGKRTVRVVRAVKVPRNKEGETRSEGDASAAAAVTAATARGTTAATESREKSVSPRRIVRVGGSQRGFEAKECGPSVADAPQTPSRRKPRPVRPVNVPKGLADLASSKENSAAMTATPPVPPSPWGVTLRPSAQSRRVATSSSLSARNLSLPLPSPPLSPSNDNCRTERSSPKYIAERQSATEPEPEPKTPSVIKSKGKEFVSDSTTKKERSTDVAIEQTVPPPPMCPTTSPHDVPKASTTRTVLQADVVKPMSAPKTPSKVSKLYTDPTQAASVSSGRSKGQTMPNAQPSEDSIDFVSHPARVRSPRKLRPTVHPEMVTSPSVKAFASNFVLGISTVSERQAAVSNLFISVPSPPASPMKATAPIPIRGRKQRESRGAHAKKESEVDAGRVRSKSIGVRAPPAKAETSPLPSESKMHMKEALSSNNDGSVKDRLKLFEALENVNKELMKARAQVSAQRRLTYAERQQQKLKAAKKIQAWVRTFVQGRVYLRTAAVLKIQRAARSTVLRSSLRRRKAAIAIQAFARSITPRLQFRLVKLQQSLDVIQQRKRSDLMLIQLTKWKTMEDMRKEVEARKAVEVADRSTHEVLQAEITKLKQENASFMEEQQKLTEMHLHFTMMRMMTEQTLQMQNKNYETVHEAVQTLTEKNDALVKKQEKLEARIEFRSQELEELKARVQYEKAVRASTEQGLKCMVDAVESRSTDARLVQRVLCISNDEPLEEDASLDGGSLGGASRGDKSTRTTGDCGFELSFRVHGFEDDEISMLDAESIHQLSRDHRHRSDSKSAYDLDVTEEGDEIDEFEEEVVEEFEVVEEVIDDDGDESCGDFSCESSVYMERSIIL